jgi:hypothetical protein
MFRNHRIWNFDNLKLFAGKAVSRLAAFSFLHPMPYALCSLRSGYSRSLTSPQSRVTSYSRPSAVPDSPFTIHHSRPLSLFTSVSVLRPMRYALCSLRSGHSRPFTIHHSPLTASLVVAVAVLGLCFAVPAHATDKLIVQDATGTNTVFVVTDAGHVGIGTSNPQASLHDVETTTDPSRGFMASQHNDGAQAASMVFRKSRGTESAPAQLVQGDYIGVFAAQYWNGTSYDRSAQFGIRTDGPVTTGSAPTAMIFYTGANTTSGDPNIMAERMRISSSGKIGIGTSAPTQKFDVNDSSIRIENSMTPTSSTAACNQGQLAWDVNYVYVCVAANTWKRSALSSW